MMTQVTLQALHKSGKEQLKSWVFAWTVQMWRGA